VVRQLLTPFVL
jgi:hypothetical protein